MLPRIELDNRSFCLPNARVMRERIPIQSKHRLVRLPLQLEPFSVDVTRLEIDLAIVKLEDGNVAVSIDWDIVWMRWHEWIYHHSVKATIDLLWNVSKDDLQQLLVLGQQWTERQRRAYQVLNFSFKTTRQV